MRATLGSCDNSREIGLWCSNLVLVLPSLALVRTIYLALPTPCPPFPQGIEHCGDLAFPSGWTKHCHDIYLSIDSDEVHNIIC